jgi:dipeptidyl-peptidase-4
MRKIISLWVSLWMVLAVQAQETTTLTIEDVFKSRKLFPKSAYIGQSLNDGIHYYKSGADGIEKYAWATGDKVGTILNNNDIKINDTTVFEYESFEFSPEEDKLLFVTETEDIYRHSSKSNFYIYSLTNKTLKALSPHGKQRLATFSPDGTKIAFVRDNNLFITNLDDMSEKQITNDGEYEHIINGTTDWVYEEEFSFTQAFYWSPDGRYIAFYKFDESKVKEFWLTYYGDLYPRHEKYKYPKAGEDNSLVTIHTYDLTTGTTQTMNTGSETDIYIPRIKWTYESDKLVIFWMNRLQNELKFLQANPATGETKTIYSQTNKYFIEITDDLSFMADKHGKNSGFLFTAELDGFNHIYHFNMDGIIAKQLTQGNWDVEKIVGYDDKNQIVYYRTAKSAPYNREIFGVSLKGKEYPIEVKAGWNNVQFSSNYEFYSSSWSDANTPPVYTLKTIEGQTIKVMEDNAEFIKKMAPYHYQDKTFFDITTTEGVKLSCWQILPTNFDTTKKYGVLFTIYGGPGSQTVQNSWGYRDGWYQLFAQNDIIVVSVDNRGTGFKGEEFRKVTYKELGKHETIDQIEAAKYFESLPYVEKGKIGIFGWSYGGFMSTLCMTKGADHFNTGVAVAPVTNWRYYDNIYTERYMTKPQDNASGYDDNSPINHVDKLKGNYLLIHGMADDNVHPHNAYDLITALVAADKEFETMAYPNSNHGIYTGKNTSFHIYKKITNFFLKHLKPQE